MKIWKDLSDVLSDLYTAFMPIDNIQVAYQMLRNIEINNSVSGKAFLETFKDLANQSYASPHDKALILEASIPHEQKDLQHIVHDLPAWEIVQQQAGNGQLTLSQFNTFLTDTVMKAKLYHVWEKEMIVNTGIQK